MRAARVFPSYQQVRSPLPRTAWDILRIVALLAGLGIAAVLIASPQRGLTLFWGLAIPSVPALIVVAPGLWREICPMGFLNQLPSRFGLSRGRDLGPLAAKLAYPFAVIAFLAAVALRKPLLNTSGAATAAMVIGSLAAASIGGFVFKGRSGWCGTFCPLGPIQRDYGQAPTIDVPNTHCVSCVSCQKNCYDFNPKAAMFDVMDDSDAAYSNQHLFFIGMMPGVIYGYFSQTAATTSYAVYLAVYLTSLLASGGLLYALLGFCRLERTTGAALFAALAVGEFYFYAAPIMTGAFSKLTGSAASDAAMIAIRGLGAGLALLLFAQARRNSSIYAAALDADMKARATEGGPGVFDVLDRSSGRLIRVAGDQTLLEALQASGLPVAGSCQSGLCGVDLICIVEGADNLTPPTPDEIATLRRIGADGHARLACQCRVRGAVVIDHRRPPAPPDAAAEVVDIAPTRMGARMNLAIRRPKIATRRLVIIGNGVAGSSVAEALLRETTPWRITMLSHEGAPFYNRMALGKIVNGSASADALDMPSLANAGREDVVQWLDRRVVAIDRDRKLVTTVLGERFAYDALVLACGARARAPSAGFLAHDNSFLLRTRSDALAIRRAIDDGARRAVVVGGGVLGVEAAESLCEAGLDVTLLHSKARLMDRNLCAEGSDVLRRYLEKIGVRVETGVPVARYLGARRLAMAELADGLRIEADVFVSCIGQIPNSELARDCGLETGVGVRVDAFMRSSDPNIYAIGDVADWGSGPTGLWSTAAAQAKTAANALLGHVEPYSPPMQMLRLKSGGIDLFAFGDVEAPPPGAQIMTSGMFEPGWWRLVVAEGIIVAANFIGPRGAAGHIERMLLAVDASSDIERLRQHTDERLLKRKAS